MGNFHICFTCMSPMKEDFPVCPHCGAGCRGVENEAMQLPVGTILAGKFMVGRVLGQGGFGITYIGYELNLGIKVAIKEFFPQGVVSRVQTGSYTVTAPSGDNKTWFDKSRERFLDEARTLAKFSYLGNIVNVRDFFHENGTAYIVMDYVQGCTAKEIARKNGGKLPAATVLEWMYPLMESLDEIHGKSLLHRDIAPDNIMIRNKDKKAVLLDFGAARQVSAYGEYSNTVNVKHGYAPVEQYQSHGNQGPWTDIYSTCATIYKLCTGVTPKQAIDRTIDKSMGRDGLKPPNQLGADFTEAQQAAIMKGLSLDPKDRQQSMAELLKELKSPKVTAENKAQSGVYIKNWPEGGAKQTATASKTAAAGGKQGEGQGSKQKAAVQPKRCKKCGGEIDPKTKKCRSCGRAGFNPVIPAAAACVVLFIIISWASNYGNAVKNMNNSRFTDSKKAFDKILFSEAMYPEAYRYVEAGVLLERGKPVESYDAFKALGINISDTVMKPLEEKVYKEAQRLYKAKNYPAAKETFEKLGAGYKRSGDYLTLIKFRQGKNAESDFDKLAKLSDFEDAADIMKSQKEKMYALAQKYYRADDNTNSRRIFELLDGYKRSDDYLLLLGFKEGKASETNANEMSRLIKLADFEDAGVIIASTSELLTRFLEGIWKDKDNVYWFKAWVEESGMSTMNNLPGSYGGWYYTISNGIYYNINKSDTSDIREIYKFNIISTDIIDIYCFTNENTYTLYRQK